MRILLLTPGTGHFYCGSCLRDNALAAALRARGHDVSIEPLYLPFHLEGPFDVEGEAVAPGSVRMGGINVYLSQKSPRLARLIPEAFSDLLDSPGLLRWASRRGDMTDAARLGAMTVSMLRGEEGRQARELEKLVEWVAAGPRPDVVVLSNAMLLGLARGLARSLAGSRVLCTLQGEAPFLDALAEPHRSEAWRVLAERARDADGFLAVSRYTADLMAARLKFPPDRVRVVPNGIDLAGYAPPVGSPAAEGRVVGYLARLSPDKGLGTLVDAFTLLARRPGFEDVRLRAAGAELRADRPFVAAQRAKLARAGLADRSEFLPNVERDAKLAFLRTLSVLSVPATYGESFGLYLLEALAAGVPVVQPRCGAFPEILAATGGGRLCEPDDVPSLADGLAEVLADPAAARELGARGRAAVEREFTADRMAQRVEEICSEVCTMAARGRGGAAS